MMLRKLIFMAVAMFFLTIFGIGIYAFSQEECYLCIDEYHITYLPIKKAIQGGFFSFMQDLLVEGEYFAYGRICLLISGIAAYIPYQIGGLQGQVLAERWIGALLLMVSYGLFSVTFIRKWQYQVLAFAVLCLLPFSLYYAVVPKPEPYLLFCLAVYCYVAVKKQKWVSWHLILLGMTIGIKISAIPIVAVILSLYLIDVWNKREELSLKTVSQEFSLILVWLILGIFLAQPALFFKTEQVLASTLSQTVTKWDSQEISWLDWVNAIWHGSGTFGHQTICFAHNYFYRFTSGSLPFYTIILYGNWIFIGSFLAAVTYFQSKAIGQILHAKPEQKLSVGLFFLGILMTILVMVKVKRVYLFYLHPNMVFLAIGIFAFLEQQTAIHTKVSSFLVVINSYLKKLNRHLSLSVVVSVFWGFIGLLCLLEMILAVKNNYYAFERDEYHVSLRKSYQEIKSLLDKLPSRNSKWQIYMSNNDLYPIEESNKYTIKYAETAYYADDIWSEGYDIIVLSLTEWGSQEKAELPFSHLYPCNDTINCYDIAHYEGFKYMIKKQKSTL